MGDMRIKIYMRVGGSFMGSFGLVGGYVDSF